MTKDLVVCAEISQIYKNSWRLTMWMISFKTCHILKKQ